MIQDSTFDSIAVSVFVDILIYSDTVTRALSYLSMVSEKALGTSFLTSPPSHLECEANMLNFS